MAELQLPARPRQSDYLRGVLKKGGLRAATAWLTKQILPIEIFDFFTIGADTPDAAPPAPERHLLSIRTTSDCNACGEALLKQLGRQSGHSVRSIVASGGRVYALVENGEVLAQLTLDLSGPVAIETPIPLRLSLPEKAGFLSYLYTYPAWRGQGMAQRLIRSTVRDLMQDGIRQVIAHVSTTNINSQNAFLGAGWQRSGLLVTDRINRILYRGSELALQGITLAERRGR